MKLLKHKDNGRTLIEPAKGSSDKELALFSHCSEGMIAVTDEYFKEKTRPLLFIHGLGVIDWSKDSE